MSKRQANEQGGKVKRDQEKDDGEDIESEGNLHFEDPNEDEFEEDSGEEVENGDEGDDTANVKMEVQDGKEETKTKVWLRNNRENIEADEEFTYESSAYDMMHALTLDWPCMSIAIVQDSLGAQRRRFPHTMYVIGGSQADVANNNKLMCMKFSELHKTKHDSDDEGGSDSDDDSSVDEDAQVDRNMISHNGMVMRLKAMPQRTSVVATWSEFGKVCIWDCSAHIKALDNAGKAASIKTPPLQTFNPSSGKLGFALDFSPHTEGRLLTGDISKHIHLFERLGNNDKWEVSTSPFVGHAESVEDVQWSPVEADVFASCSVDKSIKIWDTRQKKKPALSIVAHDTDVNVISWNSRVDHLIVSGCDDGSFRVWDLRNFDAKNFAAHFKWHDSPITSVEWSPDEDSVLVVSSEKEVTIWDLSLEAEDATPVIEADGKQDSSAASPEGQEEEVPPQLLFIHCGQNDIKDAHWHKQIPGAIVSTAEDGINVWKAANV